MRDASVSTARPSRKPAVELPHSVRQAGFGRRNEQVVMVRNQAIREEAPLMFLHHSPELGEKLTEVVVVEEDGEAIASARENVVRLARFDDAQRVTHSST